MVEAKDVTVFVVVTDEAVDVSLIKSLVSSEGDARVVICTIVSTEDDEDDDEGSHCWIEKVFVRFYARKSKQCFYSCSITNWFLKSEKAH